MRRRLIFGSVAACVGLIGAGLVLLTLKPETLQPWRGSATAPTETVHTGGGQPAATQATAIEAPAAQTRATLATPTGSPGGRADAPSVPAPVRGLPMAPSFDVVRVDRDGSAVIAGRAEPGARVQVLDGDTPVGEAVADGRGEWVLLPDGRLEPGDRTLTLRAIAEDGRVLDGSAGVTLVVPETRRDVAGRPQAETGAALALLTDPASGTRVLQAPRADTGGQPGPGPAESPPTVDAPVRVEAIDYDRDGKLQVAGRGVPGADVLVYLGNRLAMRTRVGPDGSWSAAPPDPVPDGPQVLRVDLLRGDGGVAARAEVGFDKRPFAEDAPDQRAIVVVPGNNLWAIAHRRFGEGPLYTLIFEANQGQIRDPDLIYPGQIFMVPADGRGEPGPGR